MEKLIDCLVTDFSSISETSDEWVASIYDSNFAEFENASIALKLSFFENDCTIQTELFKKLCKLLIKFEEKSSADIWNNLVSYDISVKKLIILLWYAVELALAKNSSQVAIEAGVSAATGYVLLCAIKGSSAYNIFNQFLYQRCFDLFRQIQRVYAYGFRENNQLKATKTKGKGKKKVVEAVDDADIGDNNLDIITAEDLLEDIMRAYFIVLGKVAFQGYEQSLILTISLIRDICFVNKDLKDVKVAQVLQLHEFETLPTKSEKAFALFHKLANDHDGNGTEMVYSRIVLPRLALWGLENSSTGTAIPTSLIQFKDIVVHFVEERVRHAGSSEFQIILRVLENLYCRCIDRADYRAKVSGTIVQILQCLPQKHLFKFVQRVDCFSRNSRAALRSISSEIVPLLLKNLDFSNVEQEPNDEEHNTIKKEVVYDNDKTVKQEINEDISLEPENVPSREEIHRKGKKRLKRRQERIPDSIKKADVLPALYSSLIRFCLDKTSHIRGRAITHLSSLLQEDSHKDNILQVAAEMMESAQYLYKSNHAHRRETAVTDNIAEDITTDGNMDDTNIESVDNLIYFVIRKAAEDKTAQVRKAGTHALAVYLSSTSSVSDFVHLLDILKARCVDSSVLVRKQGSESLSWLLHRNVINGSDIEDAWLSCVLPMINDREQTVQQAASKLIYQYLLQQLFGEPTVLIWKLFEKIEQQDNYRRLLVRALFHQSQEGVINETIVPLLYNKLQQYPEKENVLWMILGEVALVFKMSPKSALSTWYKFKIGDERNMVRYVAKVLVAAVGQMQPGEKRQLIDDLKQRIQHYQVDAPHISSVYLLLANLMDAIGETAPGKKELDAFGVITLKNCQKQIGKNIKDFAVEIFPENFESLEKMEKTLIRVITTIGEVIQFSPSLVDSCNDLVDALKTIMASEQIQNDGVFVERVRTAVPSLNHTAISRPPSAMASERNIPSRGPSQIAPFGSTQLSRQPSIGFSSQPIGPILQDHYIGGHLFTSCVRAYCVLALGKFCLMDYKRAKECVPVFVKQLRVNEDHIVRNNIILVICDLCIRNTQLVDRYSPIIAGCLKDRSTLVRHQTLESLTNLIKEQFIRWEGQIMYRFVSTVLDEDLKIRKYAAFCLENVLLKQFPDMFYRHFIECLLYFNDISKTRLAEEPEDLKVDTSLKFSLSGERNKNNRMTLYKFMLNTFDDKDKFTTMAHICEKALMPVVLGEFNFKDRKIQALLRDSFDIMSSKEIKLSMDVGKGNDDDDGEEPPAAVLALAKKVISETYRKGIIQTIMPHLLDVRSFLMEQRSPLLKNCLIVLRNICIEHKEQIDEVLGGDKQVQVEIEYDIKKFEEHQANEQRLAKKAEYEARRLRRSLAAANIMMSAIKSTTRETAAQAINRLINIEPIKMEIDDGGGNVENEEPTLQTATMQDESTVREQVPDELENGSSIPTRIRSRRSTSLADIKPNITAEKEKLKTFSHTSVHDENEEAEKCQMTLTTQSNSKNSKSSIAPSFAVPPFPRKRNRERAVSIDPNETALPPRAFSTPNKTISDLTFANLNLSAIRVPSMETIEED